MEFFQKLAVHHINGDDLKQLLSIKNLSSLCASIDTIITEQGDEADIYCLWGEFNLRRDEIRHGVRFSLLNCPHALAWTVTLKQSSQNIIIHCTIDDNEPEPDFVESIDEFITDWTHGLAKNLPS